MRPVVRGKFIFVGNEKFYVRGVTYGTFRPDAEDARFPDRETAERDFELMVANGVNAFRTYTVPPRWLLDMAREHGLYVMVGLPWEQRTAFLSDRREVLSIEQGVRKMVRACEAHPAILCYVVGNEIPAHIVRWHGRRAMEAFLKNLVRIVKSEDRQALVTYVNFPSTEYLNLPFVDIFCFNIFLETQSAFTAYLARLQNLAGNRPLVMAEMGLDSQRNGTEKQAEVLDWLIRSTFAAGCAGAFVFAWTDDWYCDAHDVDDWDFGMVTRDREAKPALAAVRRAYAEVPFPPDAHPPRISVVVCTHNGSRTLRECLSYLREVRYANFEVIVVNDGSRDDSANIAREFNVTIISTENRGLSSARNTGMQAATGEMVVYLDDDAYPDRDWLTYLAAAFRVSNHAVIGGPNIAPAGDGDVAECVMNAPGGPIHVLISDSEAEHVPGCNMAFRKSCLKELGGFDARFRTAGDDVDICWRVQQRGWTIGFCPGAAVWHHRRNSVFTYWKQQRGYGAAEALLERKWPEKYNALGHIKWTGRLYGKGLTRALLQRQHIYHGFWGNAPFQTLEESQPTLLGVLPMIPEWYLVILALGGLSALAFLWPKMICVLPLFVLGLGVTIWQAIRSAAQASFSDGNDSAIHRAKLYSLTAGLYVLQPLARLWGRARHGLTAFRGSRTNQLILPFSRRATVWSETRRSREEALSQLVKIIREERPVVLGSDRDRWDLETRAGLFGAARMTMIIEEYSPTKQLLRVRYWPRFRLEGVITFLTSMILAAGAALDRSWVACGVLVLVLVVVLGMILLEAARSMSAIRAGVADGFGENKRAD